MSEVVEQSEQSDLVASVTEIVRKADRDFERVSGSSRHWVRDCFLPTLNAGGFLVVRQANAALDVLCRHCNEELRLMDGQWCDRETHTICPDTVGRKHEPATPVPAGATQAAEGVTASAPKPSVSRETPGGTGALSVLLCACGTTLVCPDLGCDLHKVEPPAAVPDAPHVREDYAECWRSGYRAAQSALAAPLTALVETWSKIVAPEPPRLSSDTLASTTPMQGRREWWREGYAASSRDRADELAAVLALGVPVRTKSGATSPEGSQAESAPESSSSLVAILQRERDAAEAQRDTALQAQARFREALRALADRHRGFEYGLGPCVCKPHLIAAALLRDPETTTPTTTNENDDVLTRIGEPDVDRPQHAATHEKG